METLTMDESEIDALLSLSTENQEVPSKRRKLNPTNSSRDNPPDNNKRLSAFERIQLGRQLTVLRTKLSQTKATVARITEMRVEMEEFFDEEESRLERQARVEEEEIETLEVSLETGIRSAQKCHESQKSTGAGMDAMKSRMMEKIDTLFLENNRLSERVRTSNPEKTLKSLKTRTPSSSQKTSTSLKPQDIPTPLEPQETPAPSESQRIPTPLGFVENSTPIEPKKIPILINSQKNSTPLEPQKNLIPLKLQTAPISLKLQKIPAPINSQKAPIVVKLQKTPTSSEPLNISTLLNSQKTLIPLEPQKTPAPLNSQKTPIPLKPQKTPTSINSQKTSTPLEHPRTSITLKLQKSEKPLEPLKTPTPLKPQKTEPEKRIEKMLEQMFSENPETRRLGFQNSTIREVKIENRKYVPVRAKIILRDGKTGVIKLEEQLQSAKDIISILRDTAEDKLPLGEKIFNMQVNLDDSEKIGKCKPEESKTLSGGLKPKLPRPQQSEIVDTEEKNQPKARVDDLQEENVRSWQGDEDSERVGDDSLDESAEKSESELVVDEFASDQIDTDDSTCDAPGEDGSPADQQPEELNESPGDDDHKPEVKEEPSAEDDHQPEVLDESSADNPPEDEAESSSDSSDRSPEGNTDSLQDSPLEDDPDSDNQSEDEEKKPSRQVPRHLCRTLLLSDGPQTAQHELRVPASGHYVLASDSRFFKIAWEKHYRRDGPKDMICHRCTYMTDSRQRMQDHIWVRHYDGHFKCPLCPPSRFMLWRHSMKKHIQRVHLIVVSAPSPGK